MIGVHSDDDDNDEVCDDHEHDDDAQGSGASTTGTHCIDNRNNQVSHIVQKEACKKIIFTSRSFVAGSIFVCEADL